MTNSMDIQ